MRPRVGILVCVHLPGRPLEAACGAGRALPVCVGPQGGCGIRDSREACRGLRALGGQGLERRAGPEGTGRAEPPKVGHPVPDTHFTCALLPQQGKRLCPCPESTSGSP